MRNALGSLLALIGAAATLISPWQPWYNNRHGSSYKFYEVFGSGITVSKSGIMDSVFLIFLVTTIVAAVGVVLRSRVAVLVAGGIALGFTILWMVRVGQAAGELTITGSNNRGLGSGVAWAFGGALLMIIGALMMTPQPRRAVVAGTPRGSTRAADQGAYGTAATTAAAPTIATTAPADRNRTAQPPATAPARQQTPPPATTPTTTPTTTPATTPAEAPATTPAEPAPASERTGTERLSKEERQMLGLDEDATTEQKKQK